MANVCHGSALHFLLALYTASLVFYSGVSAMGVNFGQVANDLPAPDIVLKLVQSTSLTKVKLYGADPTVLTAFSGSGMDMVVGAGNDQIPPLADPASGSTYALQWVQTNIVPFSNTSIVAISLGNEVLSYAEDLMPLLLPAMQNLQAALVSLGLDQKIKISTPHSLGIVAQSFPPSYGEFLPIHAQVLGPMLAFFSQTGAPFMVNVYPYFAYAAKPNNISLDYVLFSPLATPVLDTGSGLSYTNMFDAQVDAVYAAISKLGYNNVSLTITETGWPSAGDPAETGANIVNAQLYNYNLVKHVQSGVGTPARPNVPIDTFIFALYNEDLKPGPTSERNFGLYLPDGAPLYNSGLTAGWVSYPPPQGVIASPPEPYAHTPPPLIAKPPAVYPYPPPPVVATPPETSGYPPPATPPSVGLIPPGPPPPSLVYPPPPSVIPAPGPTLLYPPPPTVIPAPRPTVLHPPPPTVIPAPGPTVLYPPPPTVIPAPGPTLTSSWCVAKADADEEQLQIALDWACGDGGADCILVQPGSACYLPNTIQAHASYAFNSYYQLNNRNYWDCFFSDTGEITTIDPSYPGCTYP